jgi:hypothetical protein
VINTADAVARRVAFIWDDAGVGNARLRVLSTGALAPMAALLRRCRHLEHVQVEPLSI